MERKLYEVKWNIRSGYWPEPLTVGQLIQMPPETAAALNRCSPGVLVEWTPPKPASGPTTVAAGPDDDLPIHVKRGPGRPPKAAAPVVASKDR